MREEVQLLVSGQSWSWTCSHQSMALATPSFWFRPLEWDDSQYGNSGKREKSLCQDGAWSKMKWVVTYFCPWPHEWILDPDCPLTLNTCGIIRPISSRASSLNLRRGHLSQSYVIFYTLQSLTFPSVYSIVPFCTCTLLLICTHTLFSYSSTSFSRYTNACTWVHFRSTLFWIYYLTLWMSTF